jgi:hypothetical protein
MLLSGELNPSFASERRPGIDFYKKKKFRIIEALSQYILKKCIKQHVLDKFMDTASTIRLTFFPLIITQY